MIIDQPDSFSFILESKQFSFTSAAAPRNNQLFPHSVRCQISHKTKNLVKISFGGKPKPVTAAVFLKNVRVCSGGKDWIHLEGCIWKRTRFC